MKKLEDRVSRAESKSASALGTPKEIAARAREILGLPPDTPTSDLNEAAAHTYITEARDRIWPGGGVTKALEEVGFGMDAKEFWRCLKVKRERES